MKKILILLAIFSLFLNCKESKNNLNMPTKTIEYIENTEKDLGIIKYDPVSGKPVKNNINVIQEMAKLVKLNPTSGKITIKYLRYFEEDYKPEIEVIYSRLDKSLTEKKLNSNVEDTYNNVSDDDIIKISSDKEISSWEYGFKTFLNK